MVDVEEFVEESNGIEGVDDEVALADSMRAWAFLEDRSELSHEVLQETHRLILERRQPDVVGHYRDRPVRVDDRLALPPGLIRPALDDLLAWEPANPLEAIEWHVAFERIHPFEDGNGRAGRLVYLWHCMELLGVEPVLWRASDAAGYYELFASSVDPPGVDVERV